MGESVIKVLLVDDEEGFTRLTKMNLERSGEFMVAVENDAMNATKRACGLLPDVVVLDLVMPGMDGGDVAAEMKAVPELADVKIILLTALVASDEVSSGAVAMSGGYRVLSKPVDLALLQKSIREEHFGVEDEEVLPS